MSGYIGPLPVPQGIQRKQSFTATASQTTFNTNGYTDGDFINVYLNGVRLINGTDYTATNGSDIVLTTGASASDVLDFETFQTFQLVDQQFENVTLKNPTHEDTDGGRESTLIFKGEQSGGEISTLAEIEASHDGTADDEKGDLIFRTNDGSDGSSPTEAARIDSDQNLLVGLSAVQSTGTAVGFQVASGTTGSTADGSPAGIFARKTSDGDIVTFRKDTTTVGSIGTNTNGNFQIYGAEASHVGLQFGSPSILPINNSGASADNAVDLGDSSVRFKDLYLGGGAYIGGTGASNHLEDYEEGTWTPSVGTGSISGTAQGTYTKVGNSVTVRLYLQGVTNTTSSNNLEVTGLPFTAVGTSTMDSNAGSLMIRYIDVGITEEIGTNSYVSGGATAIRFFAQSAGGNYVSITHASITSTGIGLRATVEYSVS